MKMTGAELIIHLLEREGIETVAGIPGGANLPLYDALGKSSICHVLARHEQGAGFIAQGMARASGKAAVCLATSGPGATNLITALADARLDSVPVIAITGQVALSMVGTDAFQEVDTYGMSLPVTKHNYLVKDAFDLLRIIPEAFRIARGGRPGPVLIDVPKDIQKQTVEFDDESGVKGNTVSVPRLNRRTVKTIAAMINDAKRPVLYAGGGIISSGASSFLGEFAEKSSIPVTLTLNGLGAFPCDHPLYLGMLGMHGARHTNHIIEEADLLIVMGARFDDRATGKAEKFCPGAKIIHVDIDAAEISKIRVAHVPCAADAGEALRHLMPLVRTDTRQPWMDRVRLLKEQYPDNSDIHEESMHPLNIIRSVGAVMGADTIVTTDVGQHQMWAAQAYPVQKPRTFLTSGGLGTMGFGLPAAIGASLAFPERRVVCITGDGSFQMNMQEMAVVAERNCNIAILLMNNRHLGLVKQQQELFYGGNIFASKFESSIDFAAFAGLYGIRNCNLMNEERPLDRLLDEVTKPGPCLLDIPVPDEENVFPMVPPGAANREMIVR